MELLLRRGVLELDLLLGLILLTLVLPSRVLVGVVREFFILLLKPDEADFLSLTESELLEVDLIGIIFWLFIILTIILSQ